MNLYMTMHAETNYDRNEICCSDPSSSARLTDNGIRQAERLAGTMMYESAEVIYVSEFDHTMVTAKIINQLLELPIVVDRRLNEIQSGFGGKKIQLWRDAMVDHGDEWGYRRSGGEALDQVQTRVYSWMDDVMTTGRDVLAVTHEVAVRMIAMRLDGLAPDQFWETRIPPQGEYRVDEIAQSTRLGV